MATSEDEEKQNVADLSKTLKEGERILAPTRRPDGTLRKPIRIRAGYVPQEEVAIYQPKPALLRKELASHAGPPGYDPELDPKPKTKAVKRNERKKEKRLQASLEKEKSSEPSVAEDSQSQEAEIVESSDHTSESVHSLASQMNELAVSGNSSIVTPDADSVEGSEPIGSGQDIEKRIRALKKKIRLTEALQQKTAGQDMKPEQLEKLAKLEDWRKELKLLEDKKAEAPAA
ncbi:partner of Y14 and mago isoform X1 [Gastrolobium bilobum]|uniref:partner of Y14 and mago isoform X1 n=1 Tax=Gastrolobium bilobum TaxID=150636 RepID=UPI002AB0FE64|nr:partner of Y14 and mago isoform X1 [Gastrolobium bilobum]